MTSNSGASDYEKHHSGALCTIFDQLKFFDTHQIVSVCELLSNLTKRSYRHRDFNSKPCVQVGNATESRK